MLTSPTAKRILVYGDSYTFGKIPGGMRYDSVTRFTGVMQKELGEEYDIIEEGLRGRTLAGENGFFPERDGLTQFGPILASHLPLDLIVLILGTNDLNSRGDTSPDKIINSYQKYLDKISWWCEHLGGFTIPLVLLVAPPLTNEQASYQAFGEMFKGSDFKSKELVTHIAKFAKDNHLAYFDASSLIIPSSVDGIHLSEGENHKLGVTLARVIKHTI